MSQRFDDFCRLIASPMARRRALKLTFTFLVGSVSLSGGARKAIAAGAPCPSGDSDCNKANNPQYPICDTTGKKRVCVHCLPTMPPVDRGCDEMNGACEKKEKCVQCTGDAYCKNFGDNRKKCVDSWCSQCRTLEDCKALPEIFPNAKHCERLDPGKGSAKLCLECHKSGVTADCSDQFLPICKEGKCVPCNDKDTTTKCSSGTKCIQLAGVTNKVCCADGDVWAGVCCRPSDKWEKRTNTQTGQQECCEIKKQPKVVSFEAGASVGIKLQIDDQGGRVPEVNIITSSNATIAPIVIQEGDDQAIVLSAVKIDASLPATVQLEVVDHYGRATIYTPVVTALHVPAGAKGVKQTLVGLSRSKCHLLIQNGGLGAARLHIQFQGRRSRVFRLRPKELKTLHVGMGRAKRNTLRLTAFGQPGVAVLVLVSDHAQNTPIDWKLEPNTIGRNLAWGSD